MKNIEEKANRSNSKERSNKRNYSAKSNNKSTNISNPFFHSVKNFNLTNNKKEHPKEKQNNIN